MTTGGLATEIGLLPPAQPLRSGQELEVTVRPHDVQAWPIAAGAVTPLPGYGVITGVEFAGENWLYRVRLSSGRSLRCLMPHTQVYPLGAAVQVTLGTDHGLICFKDEQGVQR